jgi:glycosyltransferase involved in cell wall biosynthesis
VPWLGKEPLISVITPTLNRRDMLADTLASVYLQDYENVEHIVVDGGSDDGTVDLLRQAEKHWGVRWVSKPDGGMYEAINEGLSMARGVVVGWVNSDDWLLPWTLSTVIARMRIEDDPHAVFGDYLALDSGSSEAQVRVYGSFRRRALSSSTTIPQPTVFWPIAFSDALGGLDTETYRQIADCEYWLRLSARFPFVHVRELLALGQDHADTKRASLADEIASEFRVLRRQYRVPPALAKIERALTIVRWRREWMALVRGRGWERSRRSEFVEFPWEQVHPFLAIASYGPHRRHPLTTGRASVHGLIGAITQARRQIEQGGLAPA